MSVHHIIERHPFGVELDGPHRRRKPRPLRYLAWLGALIVAALLAAHRWSH